MHRNIKQNTIKLTNICITDPSSLKDWNKKLKITTKQYYLHVYIKHLERPINTESFQVP